MTHSELGKRATVTFHTSPEIKTRLERLAAATKRSKSYLSNEALERYLAAEEDFIAAVERGQKEMMGGHIRSTNAARSHLKSVIAKKRGA